MEEIKIMSGSENRDELCHTYMEDAGGKFKYELIADFCRYPVPEWEYVDVSSGFCDKDDYVYLLMRGIGCSLLKLDNDGNVVDVIEQHEVTSPHFGCMTPEDHFLITNLYAHQIVEMTKDGKNVVRILGSGKPSDSGCDDYKWKNGRRHGSLFPPEIEEASSNAKWDFYTMMTSVYKTGGPFNKPTSCIVNPRNGEYIIGDGYGNCAVHRFDRDGNYLSTWGEPAFDQFGGYHPGPGKFSMVHGIEVDINDRIWANDREGNAVTVFNPDGSIAAYIQGNLGQPSDLWYDGKEYMYCVGRGGYLTIFNNDIEIVAQLGYFNSDLRAHGMCGNSRGDLFLFPTHASPDHQVVKLKRLS